MCNKILKLKFWLVDQDDQQVYFWDQNPNNKKPISIEQDIVIGVPVMPGLPYGTPGNGFHLFEVFPGLILEPGQYKWKVSIDGKESENWNASFTALDNTKPLQTKIG
jgi:hypothetical protein